MSWPELTPTGRDFKLSGYTWGRRQQPLAAMLLVSRTSTRKAEPDESDPFPKDRSVVLQEATAFAAGKITDHVGAFTEVEYEAIEDRTVLGSVDLRYANRVGDGRQGVVYGVSLHNRPTLQDVFNTVPNWSFPFESSEVALAPNAATALESGYKVAGLTGYLLWRKTIYAEVGAYRSADKLFSALRAGIERDEATALKGYNPYWRLALQHEWGGRHSAMVGAYGLTIDRFPDTMDPSGPTDRFKDLALDAQYQYIGFSDHRVSLQMNYIREKQYWNATAQTNAIDRLASLRAKATYYYRNKYGINLGYFSSRGDADEILYNNGEPIAGSANGSPDSSGYIVELNYLPLRDIRLVAQYTAYTKFNGARTNYDGFGRNASDNNTLFLLAWLMF
ncbi:MAG TPA: cytochrome C [Burkholderiales bacterium]